MSLQFKPMPWLTGIVAIMLAILISLGIWQYKRLVWKTALLAEVEASVTAPPLTSLADLERAIAAGEPVDFRRISFEAQGMLHRNEYHVFKSQTGGIFWDVYLPMDGDFIAIYVNVGSITSDEKAKNLQYYFDGENRVRVGYVRKDFQMGMIEKWVKSKPSREANRWFKFNQDGSWGTRFTATDIITHYIDIEPGATNAADLPVRRPTIRNNHRDYMLTWFSFAFLLLIFYGLIHKRAGRLSWSK